MLHNVILQWVKQSVPLLLSTQKIAISEQVVITIETLKMKTQELYKHTGADKDSSGEIRLVLDEVWP